MRCGANAIGGKSTWGILQEKWGITPRDPLWDLASYKDWEMRRMAVYAAQVEQLDRGERAVGRLDGVEDRATLSCHARAARERELLHRADSI